MATRSKEKPALQRNSSTQKRFMEKLMRKLFCFYDGQLLMDVAFNALNSTCLIPAHRFILSAASPYFKNLFSAGQGISSPFEINDIDSDVFEPLIIFCYTGQLLITVSNGGAMLKAAIVLQLDDAISTCVNYIVTHINDYTLQCAYTIERETECELLTQKIIEYEVQNFMKVSQSDEFMNFNVEKLQGILESDNLNITREEVAFDAIKRWFNYDVAARQEQLPLLIACLRLTQLDADFLLTHIQPLPGCELLAFKALSWISKPEARPKINIRFTGPRKIKAFPFMGEPEAQPKKDMQIKGSRGVDPFSFIGEPEAQPKINMQFTGPLGFSTANIFGKPLPPLYSEMNLKLQQYNKAQNKLRIARQ
uniref:Kelch-like protein 17 n=2 Tax=Bactrocera latifrons TaxID=174628 RepID=A0A0K8WGF5_BACLA